MQIRISNTWDFGNDGQLANKLKELVLAGIKTATTGLYRQNESFSKVGEYDQIIDINGKPFCVIQYTNVEIKPFLEVTFEYVKLEGEGHATLEQWRNDHRIFFKKYYPDFSDDQLVICSQFKLIERRDGDMLK